jgi:hypothetical protein
MDYLALAKEAYEASTTYINTNLRPEWDYSLKAFRMEHAAGSRYLSDEFKHRSKIVSPQTRTIIRKNESAAMQAMFSNREIVHVEAGNPDDITNVASAACMKEILEYRLGKTLPTFEIYLGGIQDAQNTGTVCSYQYWEYEERNGKKIKDKPCIELRPIENIRLDAGCSWIDPVNTSPYFCDIIPMYVVDVRNMMNNKDPKTGNPKWKKFEDSVILKAKPDVMDSTRAARLGNMQDPYDETASIKGFDVVWVMRWFMRENGADKIFYTLGTEELLTEVKDVEEVYFHGKRPYAMGFAILESHKALKTSMPTLLKPLQIESTNIRNDRMDNVRFVLGKRWLVARGRQTDVQSLVRNVPGGVTLTSDPKTDIIESNWPDITSSSYVEHDRLKSETDELGGNFSPSTKVANNAVNDTLGGSKMASAGAGMMAEYLIRTVNETWWEKVLRQLVLLEQYYETDEVVLAICASKAKLFPRFGISRITDMMLMNEVNVSVDVSFGNPQERMGKFMQATGAAIQLATTAPPGFNVPEGIKEIYSNAGYRNGERFFDGKQDPRLIKAGQMIQQLQGALEGKQMEIQAGQQTEAAKIQSQERIKGAELQVDTQRIQGDLQIRQAEIALEQAKLDLEKIRIQLEAAIASQESDSKSRELPFKMAELQAKVDQAQAKLEGERQKLVALAVKIVHETEQAKIDLQASKLELANEEKIEKTASGVKESMTSVMAEIEGIGNSMQGALAGLNSEVGNLKSGLQGVAGALSLPKRKPKGIRFKRGSNNKTTGISVDYQDGTSEDLSVQ